MGTLMYGGSTFELDDRLLAHLKIAVTAKLRLGEGFLLNWQVPADKGSGRMSLWLSPATHIQFRFGGSKSPDLNRRWLDALSRSSHGIRGMVAMTEDEAMRYLEQAGPATAP